MRHGNDGNPEVCVTMLPMLIWLPLNEGTIVPGGSNLAKGSSRAISPRAMNSASNAAVMVLDTEPISKAVCPSNGRSVFASAQT
jgi:hypothetical protein